MKNGYLVLALIACTVALAATARTAESKKPGHRIVGTWKLVSITAHYPDGRVLADPDLGPSAKGYLVYDGSGHMCAQLMNPNRFDWRNPNNPTPQEATAGVVGYDAYCGTYEVHESDGIVVHHKELALVPNQVTTSVARRFSFVGDRLVLKLMETAHSGERLGFTLTWERVN